ncbi:hypothetical protein LTR08_007430 [Meristemomyces frigidus]|nr:hypothetical protein LTR08_007430 [Meristemomyces frigidus]
MVLTKEEKTLKRQRQAQAKKGAAWVDPEQYIPQPTADAKRAALIQRVQTLQMPDDARISAVCDQHPQWYEYLIGGTARVNKKGPFLLNRTMWYNALDKTHTFDFGNKRCKASVACIIYIVNNHGIERLTDLLRAYYLAVSESHGRSDDFSYREYFITLWAGTEEDIYVLTKRQVRLYHGLRTRTSPNNLYEMRGTVASDDDSEDEGATDGPKDTKMEELGEELGAMASGSDTRMLELPEYVEGLKHFDTEEDKEKWTDECTDVMLEVAEEKLKEYFASVDTLDPEVVESIVAPAMDTKKAVDLERAMRTMMLGGTAEGGDM